MGGTVHGDAHLLHGSGIALKDRRRQQVGAVVRPPGFGLHREQSHTASFRDRHAETLPPPPSRIAGRAARGLDDGPALRRATLVSATCRLGGAQGAVMAYSWMDHRSGLDRRSPKRDACVVAAPSDGLRRDRRPRKGAACVCRTRVAVRHRFVDAGRGHYAGFGPLGLIPMTLYGAQACYVPEHDAPERRDGSTARSHDFPLSFRVAAGCGQAHGFRPLGLIPIRLASTRQP